jgi:uncharacterized membrane protein YjjP (DUF1212 family)
MAAQEVIYYQDGDVTITNTRAVLGTKTYAMTNITSVSMETMPANRTRGELIVLLGLLAIIGGAIGNQDGVAILGLIALVPGIAIAAAAKPHHDVRGFLRLSVGWCDCFAAISCVPLW